MSNIENSICEAIELIVDKSIAKAGYDRTIQGVVQSCEDATVGTYKIKYQDSSFYASATSADVTYTPGSTVYILIPGNDMTQEKTILGTVEKLGINYIPQAQDDEAYDINGTNGVISSSVYSMSSYSMSDTNMNGYLKVIYMADQAEGLDYVTIDTQSLQSYIRESSSLICGAHFKTSLSAEQQYQGNYGIIFGLDFFDNASANQQGERVTRYYTVDVDNMIGNPYNLKLGKRQYQIFNIDGANFDKISSISLFVKDFPNHKTDEEIAQQNLFDIEISDIEISGATRLTEQELNGCGISFYTPDGKIFSQAALDSATLRLVAQVKMRGKLINNAIQKIPFYWFKEDLSIVPNSDYYNKYGGRGWRCLNNRNVISEAHDNIPRQVEWIPANETYIVELANNKAIETKYKCAVVYDGVVYSKIITITNLKSPNKLNITSDLGTKFYYDLGHPTLTCSVENVGDTSNYTYIWSKEDMYGNLTSLPIDQEQNNQHNINYQNAVSALKVIEQDLQNGTRFPNEAANDLQHAKDVVASYKHIQRVDGNKIYNVAVNEITNFANYKCSVFDNNNFYLGTASITLTNSLEIEDNYTLIINNGTQTFKYNEYGVSPTSRSLDAPIDIPTLSFDIVDNLGNLLDADVLAKCDIKWKVPIKNTMLTHITTDGNIGIPDATQEYQYFNNGTTLIYNIQDKYYYNYKNNDIELTVNYKGMNLTAKTHLTFVKEGEPGTNGSEYTCKIVPNSKSLKLPLYPMLTVVDGITTEGRLNFKYLETTGSENDIIGNSFTQGSPFLVKLYKSGEEIFSGYQNGVTDANVTNENIPVTINWDILANKYNATNSDPSDLTINQNNGQLKYNGTINNHSAYIIKCTVYYGDGDARQSIYATLPLIVAQVKNSNYKIQLKDNTGFRYVTYTSDGSIPKYDTTKPFEIEVFEKINNVYELVSMSDNAIHGIKDFIWQTNGQYFDYDQKCMKDSKDLILLQSPVYINKLKANQRYFKPTPHYDGLCVTNAVRCDCSAGFIIIPIHFLLNKYGLAHLNGWDGNSIQIDDEGGFILSPQMGAGKKETDNSFTGVLMGEVQEPNRTFSDVGLLGYNNGQRSFYLNAKDGSASFGSGQAQILIDPTSGKGLLYSTNYYKKYTEDGKPINYGTGNLNGAGLLINLTKPEITFGNGNFSVTSDGHIHAKGGGDIAGWNIDNDSLFTNNKDSSFNVRLSSTDFTRNINGTSCSSLRLALGSKFAVSSQGILTAADVNISGAITATSGKIGGWTINKNSLTAGDMTIDDDGSMSGRRWSISSAGKATFANVNITGGQMSWGKSTSAGFSVSTSGVLSATGADITGKITATSGEIGGCKIINGKLTIDSAHIGTLDASVITTGTFSAERIPNLNASKITAGTLDCSNITVTNLKASSLSGNSENGGGVDIYVKHFFFLSRYGGGISRIYHMPDGSGYLQFEQGICVGFLGGSKK